MPRITSAICVAVYNQNRQTMSNKAQMTKKFLILLATVSSVAALGACGQPSATNTTPGQPTTEQAAGTTGSATTPETTASTASPSPATGTTASTATTTPAVASEKTDDCFARRARDRGEDGGEDRGGV